MTRARHPLPTDLVALVSFDGRVYLNQAKPWDRLGLDERARPLETALEQWFSFATGKHTWVNVRGATIRGLISARRRAKRPVWEVEMLIDADQDKAIVSALFSRMVGGVGKRGAERVFVRLEAGSPIIRAARDAGFFAYQEETLYRLEKRPQAAGQPLHLRPRDKGDALGIFQLYCREVPANVRAIEGMTLREWQAAQESWGGRYRDLVLEEDGVITAWVRLLAGQVGRMTAICGSENYAKDEVLLAGALELGDFHRLLTLAPSHDPGLALALKRLGFQPVGDYVLMAKRLARPAQELVRETSSNAVPVN
jgi:hypothetical protein